MRDIKFRGKNEFNEWVYGTGIVPVEYNCRDTGKYEMLQKVNYDELECFNPIYKTEEVTTETIGQYTGVKDKNGVEIYEGDILDAKGNIFIVKYGEYATELFEENYPTNIGKQFGLYLEGLETKNNCNLIYPSGAYVIGNIYDNSKLLEGDK